jgi:signal peptidase II
MKPIKPGHYFIAALCLVVGVIFADQYSKWLVMENLLSVKQGTPEFFNWFFTRHALSYFLLDREEFKVISVAPWFNLILVWNQGVSFGLFDNAAPHRELIFIALSAIISLQLVIWLALSRNRLTSFALALIIGGAWGNVIDRIRFAAVGDFLDIHVGDLHWPTFNFADSCIVLGAFLLILQSLSDGKKDSAGRNIRVIT